MDNLGIAHWHGHLPSSPLVACRTSRDELAVALLLTDVSNACGRHPRAELWSVLRFRIIALLLPSKSKK